MDPRIIVRPAKDQVDDLLGELRGGPSATSASW